MNISIPEVSEFKYSKESIIKTHKSLLFHSVLESNKNKSKETIFERNLIPMFLLQMITFF